MVVAVAVAVAVEVAVEGDLQAHRPYPRNLLEKGKSSVYEIEVRAGSVGRTRVQGAGGVRTQPDPYPSVARSSRCRTA